MTMLAHWNDTPGSRSLLAAIDAMTDPARPDVVPESERIATIDNDGTLWCEKPMYTQVDFVVRRWKEMLVADPALATAQPFKALAEQDMRWFNQMRDEMPVVLKAVGDAFAGITPEEYAAQVVAFFERARHATAQVPYHDMIYAPMRSLIDHLKSRGFRVYITTGGECDFVRAISERFYGIPREDVIGTSGDLEYADGRLIRVSRMSLPINEGAGKPLHIHARTGRRPALAIGNSDGDFEMLEYAKVGVLLRHDDGEREYAYDDGAERALAHAAAQGWITLSMKDDFATIFARDGV